MANWNNPTTTTNYATVLSELKDRDTSAIKLDPTSDTNIPTNAKRISGKNIQNWNGSAWVDLIYSVPVGTISGYAGSGAPAGYLFCQGQAVSRTTYADLFAVVGGTYGVGDGSTTFNLPNLQQRFPLGKAASGTGSTLGGTGGAIDHTHTLPAHYHQVDANGADISIEASGSHTHNGESGSYLRNGGGGAGSANVPTNGGGYTLENGIIAAANTHSHGNETFNGRVGNVNSGNNGDTSLNSGSNNPPYIAINYIIKF